jgi:hypothetical protein
MERSVGRSDRPDSGSWAERPRAAAGSSESVDGERELPVALLLLLAGEIAAVAALAASGNMPAIVSVLYRALLTL